MAVFDEEEKIYGRYEAEWRHEMVWGKETAIAFYNAPGQVRVWPSRGGWPSGGTCR